MAKYALLIGSGKYDCPQDFNNLNTVRQNTVALNELFTNPEIGGFDEVKILTHPTKGDMEFAIATLFSMEKRKDDVLLLYFAGHGFKDDHGRLYFAARNSQQNLPSATMLSAQWIHQRMDECRAKRQIIMLDCCFSGAFEPNFQAMSGQTTGRHQVVGTSGAEGRVALASSGGLEYSFEQKDMKLSIYTHFLVEGIKTGTGDLNGDGEIRADELHEYVSLRIQELKIKMKPKIIVLKDQGYEVIIAKVKSSKETVPHHQPKVQENKSAVVNHLSTHIIPPKSLTKIPRRDILKYLTLGGTGLGGAILVGSFLSNKLNRNGNPSVDNELEISNQLSPTQPTSTGYIDRGIDQHINLEMIKIPAGIFWMGSPETDKNGKENERPQHKVSVPAFYLGKYEVTQEQWRAVAAWEPVGRDLPAAPSSNSQGGNYPVDSVSWLDAVEFCNRLSKSTGRKYRLPSEAEWEYACRAVQPVENFEELTLELWNQKYLTHFYFGNEDNKLGEYAWYGNNCGDKPIDTIAIWQARPDWEKYWETLFKNNCHTHSVGKKKPNNFGLFDMYGNVWEWCEDDWNSTYQDVPNDGSTYRKTSNVNSLKVLRGGSWFDNPMSCRSAIRHYFAQNHKDKGFGFRVVVSF